MPLGNPTPTMPFQRSGASPWRPTQRFGGGAGQLFKGPFGAATSAVGGKKPLNQGFGINPITMAPVGSQAEADQLLNTSSPQGQGLMQQLYGPQSQDIAELRRKLLQNREM